MTDSTGEIVDYYTARFREDTRLQARPQGRLEQLRTIELLTELLPEPPARVLDVGGGPGVYARVLASAGYQVRLVDLVPSHVAQALAGDPAVDAVVADARALPEPDGGYDATLVLGPLYHLLERGDRVQAIREAIRVTRPGGRVVVAAISRFAGPLDFAATGRLRGELIDEARALLTDGVNDARIGFTRAYFHRLPELVDECRTAGLAELVVHGVEGPAWTAAEAAAGGPLADAVFSGALELARLFSSEPTLVAASSHLLATGLVRRRAANDLGEQQPWKQRSGERI
ncbi:class I SAM-dependent methyltransferase [Solwaraspora sp. WMMD1047]|uniref:class I SAM-dependent methyltransferase n=1 Tax=Solwaraspora sp. WMMD1047 TaxID=3016102 RepID=UPI002417CBFE|nr:class I SAM-dependent methyltransferase [Solwaraspora sp. WMMD1047]MDG4829204.1 class I SAM-dependent methyltransferase [Solwaraspora sp. WMMD1047]